MKNKRKITHRRGEIKVCKQWQRIKEKNGARGLEWKIKRQTRKGMTESKRKVEHFKMKEATLNGEVKQRFEEA